MQFITAPTIYPINTTPLQNTVIVYDSNGVIIDLVAETDIDPLKIKHYEGSICPGFVNTHCHLELSFMKDKIAAGQGLHHFIKEVESLKKPNDDEVLQAIENADTEMYHNGIVAVGDISNTANTFAYKVNKSKIYYHNFLEIYAFDETRSDSAFERGLKLQADLREFLDDKIYQQSSITPHAPYSASVKLLSLFTEHAKKHNSMLTIHNQETEDENLFFLEKKGSILERLKTFNIPTENWQAPGKTSLQATLPYLPNKNKLQLVHNTFTNQADISFANNYNKNLFWCFCVNANLYIENKTPEINLFQKNNCVITLGTDSYASNWSLSIFDEIKTLHKHFPDIELNQLLTWATINGANYLGIQNKFGSIQKGKTPGLNLISTNFKTVTRII
ncbi:MAG TPA: amidohydrolase family protein [Bacteroidia bacterium]|nr:amidohydrolase family protein [Bacteroidia bacterium]